MVTSVTSDTFLSSYHDDYRDSDDFHRILFNPGRGVQARELTQLQTILGQEIKKLSNYLFENGAIVTKNGGSIATRDISLKYVTLGASLTSGSDAQFKALKNTIVTQASTGIKARVKYALLPAEAAAETSVVGAPTGYTLLVEYTDGGDNISQDFVIGSAITGTSVTATPASVGNASAIEMPDLNMYVNGFYVRSSAQGIVIDPFTDKPTATIAYKVIEDIVTATDDSRLYENSGATLNTTSPGADRYRIRLTLSKASDITSSETAINVLQISNGVVTAIITSDNQLRLLEDVMANRSRDTNGNFITKGSAGTLACTIQDDSADPDYYVIKVDPGTAFIGGYRIEKTKETLLRVKKPRNYDGSVNDDVNEVTAEKVRFSLGNYFLIDSCGGLISKIGVSNPQIWLLDSASDKIGTAALLALDKFYANAQESFNYKAHITSLQLFDSNGTGQLRNINDTRYLSDDGSTIHGRIVPLQASYGLQDRLNSSLLFSLPIPRPYALTTITTNVANTNTGLSSGAGTSISITGTGGSTLVDPDDWIVVNTTDNETVEDAQPGTISSNNCTINNVPTGKSFDVYFYETRTLTAASRNVTTINDTGLSLITHPITSVKYYEFPVAREVLTINSITDASTSQDITNHFFLSKDITDSRFGRSKITLIAGNPTPATTITVNYTYRAIDTANGKIYDTSSYGSDLSVIPQFRTRLGETLNLGDVLDFRVTGSASGVGNGYDTVSYSFSHYPGFPKNDSLIQIATAEYYMPRVDVVYMTKEGEIKVKTGDTDLRAKTPDTDPGSMTLSYISIGPYMLNKKDTFLVRPDNSGYKMKDIRKLEKRISNLEEVTTLTMSELALKELRVADPDTGLERDKIGLSVDKFNRNTQSEISGIEFRSRIDKEAGFIAPVNFQHQVKFNYNNAASSNTTQYGNMIWPNYTEVVDSSLSQLNVTNYTNANAFSLTKFLGTADLDPSSDNWTRSSVLTTVEGNTIQANIAAQGNQNESTDPYWKQLGYSSYQAFVQDRF